MERVGIEIGDRVRLNSTPFWAGVCRGIQFPIPGCEPRYYVKWDHCTYVSGPISALMIETKKPDAEVASGFNRVEAA